MGYKVKKYLEPKETIYGFAETEFNCLFFLAENNKKSDAIPKAITNIN